MTKHVIHFKVNKLVNRLLNYPPNKHQGIRYVFFFIFHHKTSFLHNWCFSHNITKQAMIICVQLLYHISAINMINTVMDTNKKRTRRDLIVIQVHYNLLCRCFFKEIKRTCTQNISQHLPKTNKLNKYKNNIDSNLISFSVNNMLFRNR